MNQEDHSSSQQFDSESQSANLNHLAPELSQQLKQQSSSPKKEQRRSHENIIAQRIPINQVMSRLTITNQSRPRLIIDKIVLQNFKSYADTQVIGPFHQNFTSVVGPNGSGKSNLIESMLFIFGYKANWMRLKSLNQLIHNSSTMGSVQKASVEVKFKKIVQSQDGKITQIQSQAFSLRRTVKQSGESKYYINGSSSTQAQVKNKLKQQGIDLNNNRFLILQGQVEQISQMKQKSGDREKPGLLQYLEDIIGSNLYIDQIQASVTEYNTIQQIKHQKGALMKLAETQLRNMNKGKQQAIKFVKKQRQIYQIHNILQQVIISNCKYQSKQFAQKLQRAESEKDRIIKQEKEKLRKQAERIKQIKNNRSQIEILQKQLGKEKDIMHKFDTTDKNLRQQLKYKGQDLGKFKVKQNDLDSQLNNVIKESQEVKQSLPVNKDKQKKLKSQIQQMESQLQKHDRPQLKQKLKKLQSNLKKVEFDIKTFLDKQKSVQRTFQQKFKKVQKNEIKEVQLKRKFDEQEEAFQKISQAQTQATNIKQTLSKKLEQLQIKRRQMIGQLQKVSLSLKQQQQTNKQSDYFSNMFEQIMKQNIPGVIGRLGDLGTIPKQYDEIITTSCSRLDNIVVRNYEAGQQVLNFLKLHKIGRVSCILLDRIQEYRKFMQNEWNNLPNSIRLFDLVKPVSQEVRIAFYFALNDTIYCENSELGMQYSMKDDRNRRRVISKKQRGGGYIVYEMNGIINGCLPKSGGFTVKVKSKARNQQSNQTKQLQNQKALLTQALNRIDDNFKNVKGEYQSVAKDVNELKNQKQKVQRSLTQTKQQLGDLTKNANNNSKNYEQQKTKKQKQMNSLSKHLQQLERNRKSIANEILEIQKQQRSNQTQKILRLRDEYKVSKQEYQLLDKLIQKQLAILETSIKRVNENKKSKQDNNRKIQMLSKDISKTQKQIEDIQEKAIKSLARIKAAEQKIQKCKKIEQQLKVLFDEQEKQVRQSRLKIDKAKQDVEICKQKLKSYYQNISFAQEQLKKYRQTYRQLSATYDFLQEIDSIEYMSIEQVKRNAEGHNKADQSSFLNQSIQISNASSIKMFPMQRLLETSPFDDLSEDKLDSFLLFSDKMRTMLVTESQNLKKMSGSNLQIISQFRKKFTDFKKKHQQYQTVRLSQLQLKKKIEELKEKRLTAFRQGFGVINSKLKQVYQLLTRGGDAELQLIDSLDPFSDGVNFSVRPPKKAWKQINKLSGGQKTLSSLSLIFALHYYKPTPLYFMDQIDAALDFKNVSIVADYIKKRTKDAQFIIISLRNNMFELADKLVGVYKTYDKTKIVHFVPSKMRGNHHNTLQKQNLDNNQR